MEQVSINSPLTDIIVISDHAKTPTGYTAVLFFF